MALRNREHLGGNERHSRHPERVWILRVLIPVFVSAMCLTGCGRSGANRPVVPVRGTVLVRSQPAAGALVVFQPLEAGTEKEWPQGFPHASVADDGSFELSTFASRDGAPAGEYRVVVVWPARSPRATRTDAEAETIDRLAGRFSDANRSNLRATVSGPETSALRFELN